MAEAVATGVTKRDWLAQRRKALGLTQDALAGLLGVERSTVVRWERGETEPARLSLSAEIGLRRIEGHSWGSLGYAEHHLGNSHSGVGERRR